MVSLGSTIKTDQNNTEKDDFGEMFEKEEAEL